MHVQVKLTKLSFSRTLGHSPAGAVLAAACMSALAWGVPQDSNDFIASGGDIQL